MRKVFITLMAALLTTAAAMAQQSISSGSQWYSGSDQYTSRIINSPSLEKPIPHQQSGGKAFLIDEHFASVAALTGLGWNMQNLSSPLGTTSWFIGNATVFPAYEGVDTSYIGANFNNTAGTGTISNWLITPAVMIENGDVLSFWTRTGTGSTWADRLEVRMSTNGTSTNVGATSTSVGDFTTLLLTVNSTLVSNGYPQVWTEYTATISGLGAPTQGRFAFRYYVTNGGPSGANSNYIGIDLVQFNHPVAGTYDVDMTATNAPEYTIYPTSQFTPYTFSGVIDNVGPTAVTNATMNVVVNDGITNVWTGASAPVATIAVGADAAVSTTTSWTPVTTGIFDLLYTASITETDMNLLNNEDSLSVEISDSVFARDNGIAGGTLGIGDGTGGALGSSFTLSSADVLTSVSFYLGASGVNMLGTETMHVVVYDFVGGVPTNLLYQSPLYSIVPPDTLPHWHNIKLATPLNLPAGQYFVGLLELGVNIKLARCLNTYTPQTSWLYFTGVPWTTTDNSYPQFNGNYLLRPNFGEVLVSVPEEEANAEISVYPNPASDEVRISGYLPVSGPVEISILDMLGNIQTVSIVENFQAGAVDFVIPCQTVPSGVYFLQLIAPSLRITKKLLKI